MFGCPFFSWNGKILRNYEQTWICFVLPLFEPSWVEFSTETYMYIGWYSRHHSEPAWRINKWKNVYGFVLFFYIFFFCLFLEWQIAFDVDIIYREKKRKRRIKDLKCLEDNCKQLQLTIIFHWQCISVYYLTSVTRTPLYGSTLVRLISFFFLCSKAPFSSFVKCTFCNA